MWANRVCFIAFKDKHLKMNTFPHKKYKSLVFSGIIKVQYFCVLSVVIVFAFPMYCDIEVVILTSNLTVKAQFIQVYLLRY